MPARSRLELDGGGDGVAVAADLDVLAAVEQDDVEGREVGLLAGSASIVLVNAVILSRIRNFAWGVFGVGLGAYAIGIFHLLTHAFFKALLFLGSGSVIHAMSGEQDMRNMGDLSKRIPTTYKTMLIGTLAIAGIPPLAGFFSKDEILWQAWRAEGGANDFKSGREWWIAGDPPGIGGFEAGRYRSSGNEYDGVFRGRKRRDVSSGAGTRTRDSSFGWKCAIHQVHPVVGWSGTLESERGPAGHD